MKIVYVITTLVYGGAEKLVTSYANIQAEENEVHIVYFKGEPKLLNTLNNKIVVHHIGLSLSTVIKLRILIKKISPDVVHSHLGHADIITMLATFGLKTMHFITFHNVYFKKDFRDNLYYFLYKILLKYCSSCTKMISVSNAIDKLLVEKKLNINEERRFIKNNAIPKLSESLNREQLRDDLKLHKNDFVVLFVGRLAPQKSVNTLLAAINLVKDKITNLKCLIVGEGLLKKELENQVIDLNIKDIVEFRGVTTNPVKYYCASDIFVLPSLFEGLVTVVLEAFRSGLPVVVTNIDGNTELVRENENGLFFEVGNEIQLAEKIIHLYLNNEDRNRLSIAAKESFVEKFDLDKYNDWLMKLYKNF